MRRAGPAPPRGPESLSRSTATILRAEHRSPVAQLAEHPAVNRRVVGSSPTRGVETGEPLVPPLAPSLRATAWLIRFTSGRLSGENSGRIRRRDARAGADRDRFGCAGR